MEGGVIRSQQQSSAALDLRRAPITLAKQRAARGAARVWEGRRGREGGPEAIKLKSAHGSAHETTSARSARYIYHYVAA